MRNSALKRWQTVQLYGEVRVSVRRATSADSGRCLTCMVLTCFGGRSYLRSKLNTSSSLNNFSLLKNYLRLLNILGAKQLQISVTCKHSSLGASGVTREGVLTSAVPCGKTGSYRSYFRISGLSRGSPITQSPSTDLNNLKERRRVLPFLLGRVTASNFPP